jgi:hypothetical protein
MSRLVFAMCVVSLAACGKKADPTGACVVDFDDLGGKGTACSVDKESRCKSGDLIPIRPGGMGEMKMKSFEAGKTCEAVGFKVAGCSDIAIAWSFEKGCP